MSQNGPIGHLPTGHSIRGEEHMIRERSQTSSTARAIALGVVATLVLFITGAVFAGNATAEVKQVWVCKYVGKPGVDERLKEGKNPIAVSVNATGGAQVGQWFSDAQGRSYVAGIVKPGEPAPACPTPPEPTTPPTETPTTPPPTGTPTTPAPTDEPTTPAPTDEPTTPAPTDEPTTQPSQPGKTQPSQPGKPSQPGSPSAAPTDLAPASNTGGVALLLAALGLMGAAARMLRGARQH